MSLALPESRHPAGFSFRMIEHTADTGFEVTAPSLPILFERAALVLFELIWKPEKRPEAEEEAAIRSTGGDLEELLVNFLEEFLYLYDSKGAVCTEISVQEITSEHLAATVRFHPFAAGKDREHLGVKAVTYHQIYVGQDADGWKARVLLDI